MYARATVKRHEKLIDVLEMGMLLWMCRVTRKCKIRSEHIEEHRLQKDHGETTLLVRPSLM